MDVTIRATDDSVFVAVTPGTLLPCGVAEKFTFSCPGMLTGADLQKVLAACGIQADYEYEEDDEGEAGDDLCDLCMTSGVNVTRTTACGKTIGIECGCDADSDGTCGDEDCEACNDEEEDNGDES